MQRYSGWVLNREILYGAALHNKKAFAECGFRVGVALDWMLDQCFWRY